MKKTLLIGAVAMLGLTACSGEMSEKVRAMQRKDKNLSCKEILLEMNEAEFYKKTAYRNKGPKLKNMLMPLGYISTYMDADEAIEAANARVSYLERIYEIMDCDFEEQAHEAESKASVPAAVVPMYQAPPTYQVVPPVQYMAPTVW